MGSSDPAPGQWCEVCGDPGHLWCVPVANEALARLLVEIGDTA